MFEDDSDRIYRPSQAPGSPIGAPRKPTYKQLSIALILFGLVICAMAWVLP